VAALLDVLFLVVVGTFGWGAVMEATGDELPAAALPDPSHACGAVESTSCVSMQRGDKVYVSHHPGLPALGFLLPVVLIAGIVQGRTGRTPGKLVTGLRLVRNNGRPPGWVRMAFRGVAGVVDMIPLLPVVGLVAVLSSDGRRRFADMATGTRVVRA
jgi:uncharacterized RDD family membrane protein YckC